MVEHEGAGHIAPVIRKQNTCFAQWLFTIFPVRSACDLSMRDDVIYIQNRFLSSWAHFCAFSSYDGLLSRLLTDQVHYQVMTLAFTLSSLSELIKQSD